MRENNVQPGIIVYTNLITTCLKAKKIDKVEKILSEMKHDKIKGTLII